MGDETNDIYVMVTVTIIILYMIFQAVIENKKIHIIHETGFGIILGIIFGVVLMEKDFIANFNGSLFFTYILPPIIFAAGYNLKKDKFFQNLSYISIYAVLGTIINFAVTLGLMILFNKAKVFYTIDGEYVHMSDSNILYFASTMCASDAIAAVTLINGDKYPRLFSIVFGEGLLNDAVSIILFHSVAQIAQSPDASLDGKQIWKMVLSFVSSCVLSVLIGVIVGIFVIYLFRKCRMFYHNPVSENVLILMFGFLTYVIAEAAGQSGVIAMLTCGLLMSHYLVYNLSPVGVITSGVTLQIISQVAEAFLFIYLGISFWAYFGPNAYHNTSLGFMGLGFLSVIIARIFCIWFTSGFFYMINKKSWKLTVYEISIVWFAGLIRGAVAFALIQTVENTCEGDSNCEVQDQILKSSIMMIVLFTTIVLGAFMPCYLKIHLKLMEKKQAATPIEEALLQEEAEELEDDQDPQEVRKKFDEKKKQELKIKYKNSCIRFVKLFDEKVIKPFLIYNYNERKIEISNKKKQLKENIIPDDLKTNVRTYAILQNELYSKSAHMESSFYGQSFHAGVGTSRVENKVQKRKVASDDEQYEKLMMSEHNINNQASNDQNTSNEVSQLNE